VPVQPGRSQGRSASFVFAYASRHGSHIDDAGSFGSAAPRPPGFAPFAEVIDSQVRVHPDTEQGDDFAPNRSASVNPARPMAGLMLTKQRLPRKHDLEMSVSPRCRPSAA